MTRPTTKEIKATAQVAGVPVDDEIATRISNSIGPAFEGFAAIARSVGVPGGPGSISSNCACVPPLVP